MAVKYSVIIPVYNGEQYIRDCLNSVCAQIFSDFEAIVWNDGSTDHTARILEEFSSDPRIRVCHGENAGAAKARRSALSMASGKYILFVDSDDLVSPLLLATVDQYLTADTDLLQFRSHTFFGAPPAFVPQTQIQAVHYARRQYLDDIVKNTIVHGTEAVVLWNKVYRRDLFMAHVQDYPYQLLEDYMFNMDYAAHVQQYIKLDAVLYQYRYLPNSLSRRLQPDWVETLAYVASKKESFMQYCGLYSDEDQALAADWLLDYLESMLVQCLYRADPINRDVLELDLVRKYAARARSNKLAAFIRSGLFDRAWHFLRRKKRIFTWKQRIKRIIRK